MIEVFKTNINDHEQANRVIHLIHKKFSNYTANFDLDDCDNILRIKSSNEIIKPCNIIGLLEDLGFQATILEDIIVTSNKKKVLINN